MADLRARKVLNVGEIHRAPEWPAQPLRPPRDRMQERHHRGYHLVADDARGAVDEALAKRKLSRSIIMTTPGFLAVPFVVRRSRVITTMPSRLARYFSEAFELATSPVPTEAIRAPTRCNAVTLASMLRRYRQAQPGEVRHVRLIFAFRLLFVKLFLGNEKGDHLGRIEDDRNRQLKP